MVVIKRKPKAVQVEAERTGKGIIAFPRFYIKAVSGSFSIYHRLTHAYMATVPTEGELISKMEKFAGMTERELWEHLLGSRGFSATNVVGMNREKFFKDEEDWYLGAWGVYTTKFYDTHPHLLAEVRDVPKGIINEIRQEMSARQLEEHKAHQERIAQAEKGIIIPKIELPQEPEQKVEQPKRVPSIIKKKPAPAQKVEKPVGEKPKKKVVFKIPKINLDF